MVFDPVLKKTSGFSEAEVQATSNELRFQIENIINKTFKRKIFNGSANFKLIEVATTNIITSGKVPVRKFKFKENEALGKFGNKVAKVVYRKVIRGIGGGKGPRVSDADGSETNVKAATERAEKRLEKSKERVKNDW